MFDVAFSELVVIGIVALIVIGPEKLPKVARTLGHLTGRMQRYISGVKADINREIQFEDLQKLQQETLDMAIAAQKKLELQASTFTDNTIFNYDEPVVSKKKPTKKPANKVISKTKDTRTLSTSNTTPKSRKSAKITSRTPA